MGASPDTRSGYHRRTPGAEPLYQVMVGHLETFLAQLHASDRQLPAHVEHELRAYLDCGIPAHGFLRVRCEDCGTSRVVAFSCKKRGFCPSCMGRRMADTAARLVEEVLPVVPVRQWVLSFPYELRYRLAWDARLLSAVLAVFQRVVQGWYRRQAGAQGHPGGRCGAVTFVQRFGSSINLNPHLHVLMLDGVYVTGDDGDQSVPQFVPAPRLTDLLFGMLLATMMVPPAVLLIPNFLVVRELGLVDTLWGVILPGFAGAFGIFLLRQAFLNIPAELEHAARIDGCGSWGILVHVILPLSRPAIITLGLFTFMGAWNMFEWPLVVLSNQDYYPLTVGLSLFRSETSADWPRVFAASVMGAAPLIALFLAAQRYLVGGISLSGMKG